jgi:TPR repeat protein
MQIFISRDGAQSGPYSMDQVREYLASGELLPGDLAWHEGMADWQPLNQLARSQPMLTNQADATPTSYGRRKLIGIVSGVILLLALGGGLFIWDPFEWLKTEPKRTAIKQDSHSQKLDPPEKEEAACPHCKRHYPRVELDQHSENCPCSIVIQPPFDPSQLRAKAEAGDAEAKQLLARALAFGWGMWRDAGESYQWAAKSADKNQHGRFMVGAKLYYGIGVTKDEPKGGQMLKAASDPMLQLANQGDTAAQYNMSHYYNWGIHVAENPAKRIEWLRKAASAYPSAQLQLGLAYADGNGVAKDPSKVLKLIRKAASQGHSDAINLLGFYTINGVGIKQNMAEGIRLWRVAGRWGQDVPVDKVESPKWLILSAQSDGEGRRNFDALRKQLSMEQLTQTLEQAREIHPATQLPSCPVARRVVCFFPSATFHAKTTAVT